MGRSRRESQTSHDFCRLLLSSGDVLTELPALRSGFILFTSMKESSLKCT